MHWIRLCSRTRAACVGRAWVAPRFDHGRHRGVHGLRRRQPALPGPGLCEPPAPRPVLADVLFDDSIDSPFLNPAPPPLSSGTRCAPWPLPPAASPGSGRWAPT